MCIRTMLKTIIEKTFAKEKKDNTPNESKILFGKIWAVLASKRFRLITGCISLSWRQLSAELAIIYNEWYNTKFTTDAFLKASNTDCPYGLDPLYDEVISRFYALEETIGIFDYRPGPAITSRDKIGIYSEINILTGEVYYYMQPFSNGRENGNTQRISQEEYDRMCYSTR